MLNFLRCPESWPRTVTLGSGSISAASAKKMRTDRVKSTRWSCAGELEQTRA